MSEVLDLGDTFEWTDTGERFTIVNMYVDEDGNTVVQIQYDNVNKPKETLTPEDIQSKIRSNKIIKISSGSSGPISSRYL